MSCRVHEQAQFSHAWKRFHKLADGTLSRSGRAVRHRTRLEMRVGATIFT